MARGPLDLTIPSTGAFTLTTDFCGLFLLDEPEPWLSTAAWVRVYDVLGIPAGTARSALHRLDKAGFLSRGPRQGVPGYALSDAWLEIIRSDPAAGELMWLLVAFTVPEARRDVRHQLRSLLVRLGFVPLGGGSWLGRGDLIQLQDVLSTTGLREFSHVFLAEPAEPARLLSTSPALWDLDAARQRFDGVVVAAKAALAQEEVTPEQAFVDVVTVRNSWRLADAADAHLPAELLPEDWPREDARTATADVVEARMPAAGRWFQAAACA